MKFISIDPGFEKVGFAIFKKKSKITKDFEFITSGMIKAPKSIKHENRLKLIYESLDKLFIKYKVDFMVIESLFMFKNQKTVLKVAQAIGVTELLAAQKNIPIERLTPLQIKQAITGYGTADKKAVAKMIRLELGEKIDFEDDDQSDAVACGLAYCYLCGII